jgi:hypothetical protein
MVVNMVVTVVMVSRLRGHGKDFVTVIVTQTCCVLILASACLVFAYSFGTNINEMCE